MIIGIPREIKDNENRVGITPTGVAELVKHGHEVRVEQNAGLGSGFHDDEYAEAGAKIVSAEEAWSAGLVIKVKEPLKNEFQYFSEGKIIYTYFHLAGVDPELTRQLLVKKVTAVAYETVEDAERRLPLLAPMSAVAGRVAVQVAAHYLAKFNGGSGILIGGVKGVKPAIVTIIGAGVVGYNAAQIAIGMGAETILIDVNEEKLYHLKHQLDGKPHIVLSNRHNIAETVKKSDIVIGAVLIPGGKAPFLVTEDMIRTMRPGSVVVDVAIDQGGCIETSKPTSHSNPIFKHHGVIHYCVTNMPGAFPRTSTIALTNATLHYALKIAIHGLEHTAKEDKGFSKGINTYKGFVTYKPVADDLQMAENFRNLDELF